jgi:hypothetical protein
MIPVRRRPRRYVCYGVVYSPLRRARRKMTIIMVIRMMATMVIRMVTTTMVTRTSILSSTTLTHPSRKRWRIGRIDVQSDASTKTGQFVPNITAEKRPMVTATCEVSQPFVILFSYIYLYVSFLITHVHECNPAELLPSNCIRCMSTLPTRS